MKLPSTMTTVSGSAHHASLRRCAAGIGGRASSTRLMRSLILPGVLLLPVLVQVTAVAIVDDDRRKRLHLQPPDRLGPEVLVGHDLQLLHVTREHRPGAADGPEVDAAVLAQGVLHGLASVALAHRPLEPQL